MAITTRIVRRVLLGCAVVLLAVIFGFVAYAHYRARHFLRTLPGKLGVDIKQETNGFTYSQSVGGRTVFSVHASKEVQRTNGRITLHDVGITLYGRTPGSADRIHGSDFEYDPADGKLTAAGEVFLDLEAPGQVASGDGDSRPKSHIIHVKTSGLVFLEKQRTANTDQSIEFEAGDLRGSAIGAAYDSSNGLIVLKRDVNINGRRDGRPLALTASHAELDRDGNVVRLSSAFASETTASGTETLAAQQARVTLSADGAPRSLQADDRVLITQGDGGSLSGDHLTASFRANNVHGSLLQRAQLRGDVRLKRSAQSGSDEGRMRNIDIEFDGQGHPSSALLTGGVNLIASAAGAKRTLLGQRVQLDLRHELSGRSLLHQAQAFGDVGSPAQLTLVATSSGAAGFTDSGKAGPTITNLRAMHLTGTFRDDAGKTDLQTLSGEGRPEIEQTTLTSSGKILSVEQSTGDSLQATFAHSDKGRFALSRAEQHGHVDGSRRMAAHMAKGHSIAEEVQRFRSQDALFEASSDQIVLTSSVAIADGASSLLADRVAFNRADGNGSADGAVRISYLAQNRTAEPLHITAARATSTQASGVIRFLGSSPGTSASAQARLWQGGSQVQAPEIDFDRKRRLIIANGRSGNVSAVLAGTEGKQSALTRVSGREFLYNEATAQIELNGSVKVEQTGSVLQSAHAVVALTRTVSPQSTQAPATGGSIAATGMLDAKVDHITAYGGVRLSQPGREAKGERLVYTARDQTYTLTGTAASPPVVVDPSQGRITGASLRFRGGDGSVEISGAAGQRVRSETELKPATKRK